jgi:catechol 2,3-dioxygenase-like lactoylglutathione lyase family enzyme
MKLGGFLHVNIRCSMRDLPAIEKFYGETLGLKRGYRPAFPSPGIWLYDGDDPIVHVNARFAEGTIAAERHNGSIDHVAFRAAGAAEFRERLQRLGIAFDEQNVAGAGYQIFVRDPVGTLLEFNFAESGAETLSTPRAAAP